MVGWKAAMAAMDQAVAGAFDEDTLTLQPRRRGTSVNSPGMDDDQRQAFDFLGSFELAPAGLPASRRPAGDPGTYRDPVSHEAVVSAVHASWPWMPIRKDHVTRGGTRWSIDDLVDDGTGRIVLYVNRV